jgi:hypothetical protein
LGGPGNPGTATSQPPTDPTKRAEKAALSRGNTNRGRIEPISRWMPDLPSRRFGDLEAALRWREQANHLDRFAPDAAYLLRQKADREDPERVMTP